MRQTTEESILHARNEGSAVALRLAITRTARRMRQEAGSDLSPTALASLASVERHAPLTPTRLAEIEGVKRPTTTRVVNHLVESGLIERIPDPNDGRSCQLTLTEAGTGYLAEARSRKSAYLARLLDSLPADDVATLERAAILLEDALEGSGRREFT
ncbi:MAG: MarR family winged helix-turn-helix transcriptional regulator [Solirubrobacterales bacterium]